MNSAVVRRAKLARVFGLSLMAAGLVPIVWLAVHSLHPLPIEPWPPLKRLPSLAYSSIIALIVSLPGLVVMWLGAAIAVRQGEVLEAERRETADRLRRVREYGIDGRIEPYIGSPLTLEDEEPR